MQCLGTLRKTTTSSSSSSDTYVGDDCSYESSAYKGVVAGATTALEIGVGFCSSMSFFAPCAAASAFAVLGSAFSDGLDSQNICANTELNALNGISQQLNEIESAIDDLAKDIGDLVLEQSYHDTIDRLELCAEQYTAAAADIAANEDGNFDLSPWKVERWFECVLPDDSNDDHKYHLGHLLDMIETGTLVSKKEGMYSSDFNQKTYCSQSMFSYMTSLLVDGWSQWMMARQVEYSDSVFAIYRSHNIEDDQVEMANALLINEMYYKKYCPCLLTGDCKGNQTEAGENTYYKKKVTRQVGLGG